MKQGIVYILSNKLRTTFYIGVTADLPRRISGQRSGKGSRFAARYRCVDLMYYEIHPTMYDAIVREKQLKRWHRSWKLRLIRTVNPTMNDLSDKLF